MCKKKVVNFSLRLPKELHRELTLAAKDDYRSLHSYILKILQDHLSENDKNK